MKRLKHSFFLLGLMLAMSAPAQDVDEIINGYFENTGGYDTWADLKGMKISAKVNQGGVEFPVEIVQMADGRQYTKITIQGQIIKQNVFDGETSWNTNFQTMKPEKADDEATANVKLDANDFPESLFEYKKKGYTVELMGKETMEGAETYKVKLTKEPKTVDGQKVEDIVYYYFDAEAFIPLAQETEAKSGPAKGMISLVTMSDYQEVDGLYFPFAMTQGVKGGQSQPIMIEAIELNPEVAESEFAFPSAGSDGE